MGTPEDAVEVALIDITGRFAAGIPERFSTFVSGDVLIRHARLLCEAPLFRGRKLHLTQGLPGGLGERQSGDDASKGGGDEVKGG
jgi:hypothetical protein